MTIDDEIITLEIHDVARGGAGVARMADGSSHGKIVFVPYAAPGDVVKVRLIHRERRYAHGELVEVYSRSPQRVEARCPAFGRCGGCDWQHLPYSFQWEVKLRGIREVLGRAGLREVLESGVPFDKFPSESPWSYRNRVQLRGHEGELGYLAEGTHQRVPVDGCPIAREEINSSWGEIRQEGRHFRRPYKVEVEVDEDGGIKTLWNPKPGDRSFRQINDEGNRHLQEWVALVLTPGRELLDLFGGDGNLSGGLTGVMSRIDVVDVRVPRPLERGNVHFHEKPVLNWLQERVAAQDWTGSRSGGGRSAILDPPRGGLGMNAKRIATLLEKLDISEVVHVGCDADRWSQDLKVLVRAGWRIVRVGAVDLFPQTHHVEALAFLKRSEV